MHNGHKGPDHADGSGLTEYSVIFPETGEQYVSYMSIREWTSPWKTNYAGLARSTDGNTGPITPRTMTRSRCGRCSATATGCTSSPCDLDASRPR